MVGSFVRLFWLCYELLKLFRSFDLSLVWPSLRKLREEKVAMADAMAAVTNGSALVSMKQ